MLPLLSDDGKARAQKVRTPAADDSCSVSSGFAARRAIRKDICYRSSTSLNAP